MSADATEPEANRSSGSTRDEQYQHFQNDLKLADFAEAERITPARTHAGYWFFFIVCRFNLAALIVFAVFLLFAFVPLVIEKGWSWQNAARTATVLLVFISFFGSWTRRLWSRRFGSAQQRLAAYPYGASHSIAFSAEGIRIEYGLLQQCEMKWDDLVGFREGHRVLMLIRKGSHEEVLLSKSSAPETAWQQLRSLVTSNVGLW